MSVGNVTIRFSVQDAEVVRKALEQLGKNRDSTATFRPPHTRFR